MISSTLAEISLQWDWSQWIQPVTARWWQETACSMLVGVACGVLGCFVVLRRMALIGDALSHAVLPGVVIALLVTGSTGIGPLLIGALAAGLGTALLIALVSRISRTKEDSAIGIVFTALFSLGVILISGLPRGVHFDLKCFLFGDPLAVGSDDLLLMTLVAPLVVALIALLYHPLRLVSFDPIVAATMGLNVAAFHYLLMGLLSATVVAGLKTTGVILVVAMVITPASAAYQLCNRLWPMLVLAGLFGALSALAGMSLAFITNSPSGPAMVIVATFFFTAAMIASPSHGLAVRWLKRRRMRRHIETEDLLKAAFHLTEHQRDPSPAALASATRLSSARISSLLGELRTQGLLHSGPAVRLTEDGRRRALEMVRAHRLWESYLADQAGLEAHQVHEVAERLEHVHDLADEIDATLGNPATDPHGEAIPPKTR
jgi:ABC-type Mn2+/Zn2+ transport system permease subunit/Mn-dependent DtxR family transcriptional regulator